MKLYLLHPNPAWRRGDYLDPWHDRWDAGGTVYSMLIAAETEQQARQIANKSAGAENIVLVLPTDATWKPTPWLDPDLSTCREIAIEQPGVMMRNGHWVAS